MTILNKLLLTASLSLLSIIANSQNISLQALEGNWKSNGYGYYIKIENDRVQLYDYCKSACTPNVNFSFEEFDRTFEFVSASEKSFTIKEAISEYDFVRVEELPTLCIQKKSKKNKDPLYNFDALWNTFDEQFAYFEERNVDWEALREKYRAKITKKTKPIDLFITMDSMLLELNDGHSTLFVPDKLGKKYAKHQQKLRKKRIEALGYEPKPIHVDSTRSSVLSAYIDDVKTYHFGNVNWGITNNNIAMVQINGMGRMANYDIPEGASEDEATEIYERNVESSPNPTKDEADGTRYIMDKILKDIANADACIVDIRFNGGGLDAIGMEFLRSFIQKEGVVFTKKTRDGDSFTRNQEIFLEPAPNAFQKKVFLLTSYQSASAAETFAMGMRALCSNLEIIGSPTQGIFSDMVEKVLPNGWGFAISTEVYFDDEGKNYEGIGILPDHPIEYNRKGYWFYDQIQKEIQENGKDQAIEKALSLLK